MANERENIQEETKNQSFEVQISELWEGSIEAIDYFTIIFDEITKYPFWQINKIQRKKDFMIYYVNNNTTEIKIRYLVNKEITPHIVHLLHQTISSYLKKRRTIRTKTKLNFLAARANLVIEIKPNK